MRDARERSTSCVDVALGTRARHTVNYGLRRACFSLTGEFDPEHAPTHLSSHVFSGSWGQGDRHSRGAAGLFLGCEAAARGEQQGLEALAGSPCRQRITRSVEVAVVIVTHYIRRSICAFSKSQPKSVCIFLRYEVRLVCHRFCSLFYISFRCLVLAGQVIKRVPIVCISGGGRRGHKWENSLQRCPRRAQSPARGLGKVRPPFLMLEVLHGEKRVVCADDMWVLFYTGPLCLQPTAFASKLWVRRWTR